MVRKCASTLILLGLLSPGMAIALGLGELTLHSYLNEPLKAEVDLLETGGLDPSQIKIRLATREDFSRAGVEREYFLTSLKFTVEMDEDGEGRLHITSTDPVREPFLDFLVEARWPTGRLLREYTVLLDPPLFSGPESGIVSSVKVPDVTDSEFGDGAQGTSAGRGDGSRYGQGASDMPAAGAEYLVQRDDTLWSIARRSRPNGSTIQQTMLDIKRLNPEAFIGNNINQLKAGYVLRLPTTAEISDVEFEQAVAEIAEQEQNWQENLAAIDARRLDPSSADDAGAGAGQGDEEGRLQIAGVDGDTSPGAEGDVSARMENLDRVERDNADLTARINSMEEQVETLKRLVTLKDDQISALQSALAGGDAPAPVIDEQEGTIDDIVNELPDTGLEPADQATADAGAETPPAFTPRPPAPLPQPEPGIVDMLMDYLLYIVGLLLLIVAGVAWRFKDKLKLGSLKISVGRGRTKQEKAGAGSDDDDEFAGVELVGDDGLIVDEFMDDSGDDDAAGADSLASFSAPDEEAYAAQFESGDALAEADIYIAYGRFPQAVDLLKTAISIEPANAEYRVKLMEACVEMVESGEYQQQYADLQVIGDQASLERARAMLDAVDGGEVWLDDLPEPSITPEEVEAAQAAAAAKAAPEPEPAPAAADETALELDDADGDVALDLELDDSTLEDIDSDGLDLDLDLDLESDTDEPSTDLDLAELELDASETPTADLGEEPSVDLGEEPSADLGEEPSADLGEEPSADLGEEPSADLSEEPSADLSEEPVAEAPATDDEDFDLGDFSIDEEPSEEVEIEAAEPELDDDLDLSEFNIADFDEDTPAEAEPEIPEDDIELPEIELDELSASLDDASENDQAEPEPELELAPEEDGGLLTDFGDLEIEEGPAEDAAELSLDDALEVADEAPEEDEGFDLDSLESFDQGESEANGSGDDEGLVFAADGDEIATKLDLARAYMDMGDHEGASSILEEVLADGSDEQKQEAQTLLDSID